MRQQLELFGRDEANARLIARHWHFLRKCLKPAQAQELEGIILPNKYSYPGLRIHVWEILTYWLVIQVKRGEKESWFFGFQYPNEFTTLPDRQGVWDLVNPKPGCEVAPNGDITIQYKGLLLYYPAFTRHWPCPLRETSPMTPEMIAAGLLNHMMREAAARDLTREQILARLAIIRDHLSGRITPTHDHRQAA